VYSPAIAARPVTAGRINVRYLVLGVPIRERGRDHAPAPGRA
jgi:hypothetical protein